MTDKPISLDSRRAQVTNDSKAWTPESLLRSTLERLELGQEQADSIMVILGTRSPDGILVPGTVLTAKLSVLEMFGLLDISKLAILQSR